MKRNVFVKVSVLVGAILMSISGTAHAAGFLDMFRNLTDLAYGIAVFMTAAGFVGGIGAFLYAGKLLLDKAGQNGEQVEVTRIVWSVIGGSVLVAIGFIAMKGVETLGGSASNVGQQVGHQ